MVRLAASYLGVEYGKMKKNEKIDEGVSFDYFEEAVASILGNKGFLGLYNVIDDIVKDQERRCNTFSDLLKLPVPDGFLAVRFATEGDEEDLKFDAERDGEALKFLERYGLDSARAREKWTAMPVSWVPKLEKKARRARRRWLSAMAFLGPCVV